VSKKVCRAKKKVAAQKSEEPTAKTPGSGKAARDSACVKNRPTIRSAGDKGVFLSRSAKTPLRKKKRTAAFRRTTEKRKGGQRTKKEYPGGRGFKAAFLCKRTPSTGKTGKKSLERKGSDLVQAVDVEKVEGKVDHKKNRVSAYHFDRS